MEKNLILGYWGIRGRAQVCRYLLEYTKTPYTQKLYGDPKEWFGKDMEALAFPYANLPYIKDGDFKLSETAAIEMYIIKKSKKEELLGIDLKQQAEIMMITSIARYDLYYKLLDFNFNPNFVAEKAKFYTDSIKPTVELLMNQIGSQKFLLGDKVTHPDFILYEAGQFISQMFPKEYEQLEVLQRHAKNFQELPGIKEYVKNDAFKNLPYVPPHVKKF
eukprot:TRINITY_DN750_c0_g1_i2.p2 TRINITY_DN750_c0_g1~~TRINITY_DN750_c0_g1_i2.p2  ORF type:complete len:218 (-),score=46.23 TRINITY_DN750_c0_g1_i2:317-970(-)